MQAGLDGMKVNVNACTLHANTVMLAGRTLALDLYEVQPDCMGGAWTVGFYMKLIMAYSCKGGSVSSLFHHW